MGYNHFEAPWEGPNLRPFVLTKEIIKDPLLSNHLGHFLCGVWEDVFRNIYKRLFPSRLRGRLGNESLSAIDRPSHRKLFPPLHLGGISITIITSKVTGSLATDGIGAESLFCFTTCI